MRIAHPRVRRARGRARVGGGAQHRIWSWTNNLMFRAVNGAVADENCHHLDARDIRNNFAFSDVLQLSHHSQRHRPDGLHFEWYSIRQELLPFTRKHLQLTPKAIRLRSIRTNRTDILFISDRPQVAILCKIRIMDFRKWNFVLGFLRMCAQLVQCIAICSISGTLSRQRTSTENDILSWLCEIDCIPSGNFRKTRNVEKKKSKNIPSNGFLIRIELRLLSSTQASDSHIFNRIAYPFSVRRYAHNADARYYIFDVTHIVSACETNFKVWP